jgi:hypothetical protein
LVGSLRNDICDNVPDPYGWCGGPAKTLTASPTYEWSGFYAGINTGRARGSSKWPAATGPAGSLDMLQPFDMFKENGSFYAGQQAGYNYVMPNRFGGRRVVSKCAKSGRNLHRRHLDTSSPVGAETYSETVHRLL